MNVNDKERIDQIQKKRDGKKVTCFCEWEKDIDWMLRKLSYRLWSTDDDGVDHELVGAHHALLRRNNVLAEKINKARTALQ